MRRSFAIARFEDAFVTPFAAFAVLLHRYTGQERFVVGVPVANGHTLPFVADLSGDPCFGEVIARVRAAAHDGFAHDDVSIEALLDEPAQVQFASGTPSGRCELAFEVHASGLAVTYDPALFDDATIDRLAGHFERLAGSDANTRVSAMALLTEPERQQLLVAWNATTRRYPELRLDERFEHQVDRAPDAVAVRFERTQWTYRELDARANQLAHRLRALGVDRDVLVPIVVERSLEMVAAILGVLKAGGAYVPLDPEAPPDRQAFMLADIAPRVIVTQAHLAARLPAGPWHVIDAGVADGPTGRPARGGTLEDLAYGIFTSGSTGAPKCALVEHRSVANLLVEETAQLDARDRVLQKTPLTFDPSVLELFAPLAVGACVVVARPDGHRDVRYLLDVIRAERITTIIGFVPSLLEVLVAEPALAECTSLRRIQVGGEALSHDLQQRFFARCTAELHNAYGPTETTIYSTLWRCRRDSSERVVPIGRPVGNTRVYVLDPHAQPVPIGVTGELYIGGAGVARGYLNRAELTEERFVADPFVPGARLYRTGDLVRFRADGNLEFLGRTDEQVKIRGFRVELGEIEAGLRAHPAIRDVVVLAREDVPGQKHLVAYAIAPHAVEPESLRSQLREHLPAYMIPAAFVFLDAFPRVVNGKVDRRALPAPRWTARGTAPLQTPMEQLVAVIWRQVLALDDVGAEDDFFALGGHSLLAMQVLARIREATNVELSLRGFFDAPTVRALAATIDAGSSVAAETIPRTSGPARLSSSQEQLWFLHALLPTSAVYNIPFALRLRGPLDVPALARSIDEIARRHDVLRATISGAVPHMHVSSHAGRAMQAEAVTDLDAAVAAEVRTRFDLERGPLMRTRLLRAADDDHVLVVTMHHIISDGWSYNVFERELLETYAAFAAGRPCALPALPIQFGDYAAWERTRVLDRSLAYWKTHLAGAPIVLELPTDRARPPIQSFAGARARFVLPAHAVTKLCRAEGVTPFMALFAVFSVLLHRYTAQDKLLVGVPVANRDRTEVEQLIGMFVNTLAFAADLTGNPTFRELLQRVRAATLGGFAHQEVPFSRLVEELQPARDLSRSPIVQVMFAYQTAAVQPPSGAGGLSATRLPLDTGTSKFDLMLEIEPNGDELRGSVEYSTDLFDATTIARFIAHFERLVDTFVAEPGTRVAEATLLTPEEQAQLAAWNATERAFPDRRLEELFEEQVARTPHAIAVLFEGAALTYAELDARANQIAHRLRALGVGADTLVPLYIERSLEMMPAILAILKADGAYVPLDPEYPADRLAFMLADCAPRVVVTLTRLASALPAGPWEVLCVDAPLDGPTERPRRTGTAKHLAYGIYTSGSTGKPKCALVEHASAVNLLFEPTYHLDATDRVLQKTPLTFDASVPELFGPLRVGARLVVARPGGHKDTGYLTDVIRTEQITSITFVPSLLEVFAEEPALASCTSLRRVLVGGEALPYAVQERFFARSQAELHNTYGPTETTVTSAFWPCQRDSTDRTVPIGWPVGNTQLYVLDAHRRPVPIGVLGELYIGGVGLARGYLDRPELTAERFVVEGGTRLYRTGDVARYRADGALEFLGRTDHQVKIRGFRVELGEIETCLRAHAAVRDVVVLARDKHLIAYVVPARGLESDELRAHVRSKLPDYMVPSAFVFLDAFPLMVNGKVDRKALPTPVWSARAERVAPRTPAEELVAAIWLEVLGTDQLGVDDNFFDLGGHSLLAMQVIARIRESARVDISIRAFFDAPTIRALARMVEAGTAASADAIPVVSRGEPARLSSTQEQLWFLHALDPASAVYNIPFAVRLHGVLDEDALARSIDAIVRRHDVLRATIVPIGDIPHMRVTSPAPYVLHAEPVASLYEAESIATAEAQASFDLEHGPLFRTRLLRLAEDDHVLVVTMHHIISDGWSGSVFEQELLEAYAAFAAGVPWSASAPRIQYADYASWQRTQPIDDALAYWKAHLANAPLVLEMPTDRTRPPVQTFTGARQRFVLTAGRMDAIAKLCRSEDVTPFMALFTVFSVLLHRYTAQERFVVGVPVANRSRTETEPLIGVFINTLAFAADLTGNPTFREVLQRVRVATLGGFAHQEMPFNRLVEELQPARDFSRTPIVQVMFTYQSATPERGQTSGLAVSRLPIDTKTSKFELTLELAPHGHELAGVVEYNTDLFDGATIARLIERFELLVDALVVDPAARVAETPVLVSRERTQLATWNATARDVPDRRLEELFEEQVARTPHATAVRFENAALTYAELDARANQIAHRLRALGVGPDALVPIYVERSLEMMPGLLGILKADGAYVPLDPEYPADRLAFMLEDCAPRVVVTQTRLASALPAGPWAVLCIDAPLDGPTDRLRRAGTARHLAYGIYTSGSTGKPKCALVEHASIVNLLFEPTYHLDATDRVLQKTPLTFDASVPELFGPLRVGARIVVARPEGHKDVAYLIDVIRAEQITSVTFVPSLLEVFADEPALSDCTSLRRVLVGGEALSYAVQEKFFARTHAELHNTYGPTETTVTSSFWPCQRDTTDRTVPIGRPVGNTQLHVLDANRQPVPIGVLGELYIGGAGVARGYLNRPELTAERFVTVRGARLYRTGDVVRHRADGALEFLGRTDHQVKVRGFRIELGEIEACLRVHGSVREVVVLAREDVPGQKHLVAYIASDQPPDVDELRALVRSKLPEYMMPSAFVLMSAFPLMVNGKVDRKALPAPARAAQALVAPRNRTEKIIAKIWCEVLGLERVGVTDDFFALGGHSLLAMQIVAKIRRSFEINVPQRMLLQARTIEEQARLVTQNAEDLGRLIVRTDGQIARATIGQEQFFYLSQDDPDPSAYFTRAVLAIDGPLDRTLLEQSYRELVAHHSIFRTAFREIDGLLHQIVLPEPVDPPHLGFEENRDVEACIAEMLAEPCDLARGYGVIRGRLIALAPQRHMLVLLLHHIASDGAAFVDQLFAGYTRLHGGAATSLPDELPLQYIDFAHARARWSETATGKAQRAYWDERILGAQAVELPTDVPRAALDARRDALPFGIGANLNYPPQYMRLPADVRAIVQQAARAASTTPYVIYLGALAWLFHERSRQDEISIQTTHNNRADYPALEQVQGPLAWWTHVRVDTSGQPTFREVVARATKAVEGARAHGIVEDYFQRVPHPVRRIAFNYLPLGVIPALHAPDLQIARTRQPFPKWKRHWDVHLTLQDFADETVLVWTATEALFRHETVLALLDRYIAILAESG